MNRMTAMLPLTLALTGCQSGTFSSYSSPRVTGQVLAADTRQPLPETTVKRMVVYPGTGTATAPKAAELQTRTGGVRTDADGRFVLEAERVLSLFGRGGWHSVTVSFAHAGYVDLQTNFTTANFKERSSTGVPLVEAGDILLKPKP
jgi:hypothetical protein